MDSRERVITAMRGGRPDRVPCALAFYRFDREPASDTSCLDLLDVQFVPRLLSPADEALACAVEQTDEDTRLGTPGQLATYARWGYRPAQPARRNPLSEASTLDELDRFALPDADGASRLDALRREVARLRARGLAVGGNLPHLGGELFETAWRLRGLQNLLLDLVERPAWAELLLDRLAALAKRNAETLAAADVDVLALDDDVGMPGTMLIGPPMWRRFFKPRLAGIIAAARAVKPELTVLYHSDGFIEPIVGDLLEIGVNALNPLQPEHMDAVRLRRAYGTRLALWGCVGRQTTFGSATPEEIREEVRQRIEQLGRAGLILCPSYDVDTPDVPWANIAAFLEAVSDYGRGK
jgi:uroporphyrinogen decarboxylase